MKRKIQLAVKRLFDLTVSFIFIVIFSIIPVWLVIAIAIKATSKGPVIFKQERVGKDGKLFKIYKFRTMLTAEESYDKDGKPLGNYERITKVGAFLRRTSLDELAQLFNVFNGTMSIVGPRPTLSYQVEKYTERQRRRLEMRPGVTGWAQVNGRNDLSWGEKIEFDIEYIDRFSLWLDCKILFKTVGIVLGAKGIEFKRNDEISSENAIQKDNVLVLCGGIPQVALIGELQRRGYCVILADYNPQCAGATVADEFYPVSVMDRVAVKQLAIDKKVKFVITACADQVLRVMADVSQELELPCYIDAETAFSVSDKAKMKKVFADNDIPTSCFVVTSNPDIDGVCDLRLPVIVKPVDAYSSRGVKKVSSKDELREAIANAVKISKTGTAIIEEFVDGEELSVDVYVENDTAHILCQSRLDKIGEDGKFVICRTVYPAKVTPIAQKKIEITAQKIADAFGLVNSPMLIQLIVRGDDISVIEFCARTGGGDKFRLIKKVSGFDVISAVVDLSEGKFPHVVDDGKTKSFIINEFLYVYPGTLDHMEGFEELREDGTITEFFQLKQQGVKIDGINSSGDRVAYCTIEDTSVEGLKAKHNKVAKVLKVIDVEGKDILRHDLIERFTIRQGEELR